ncbi:hypothetical protein EAF07_05875 [Streptococcus hillyeri]|uniref:Phage protein n=1 Tax=Streptococcus hillyeri TaxID=2282420 RepID=A0A3L9DT41_9STRE|nr:hypothetical protein EAF07_05875 [Streptococcus hillyeri]
MKKLLNKIKNFYIGGTTMMINYFAMQVELGWITLEQVPKKFREKVRALVEVSSVGTETTDKEE